MTDNVGSTRFPCKFGSAVLFMPPARSMTAAPFRVGGAFRRNLEETP